MSVMQKHGIRFNKQYDSELERNRKVILDKIV